MHHPVSVAGSVAAVVIGGANVDHKSVTFAAPIMGTSNPGQSRSSLGGVGRNVAENLARLGVSVSLVTVVGDDSDGARIVEESSQAGVSMRHAVRTSLPTGSYTAILSESGALVVAVSAMESIDQLTPDVVDAAGGIIASASALILDCNVPDAALARAAAIADQQGVPIVIDPVSVAKSARLTKLLLAGFRIHTITPNRAELAALVGLADVTDDVDVAGAEMAAARSALHAAGVSNIWVRLGQQGSVMSCVAGGLPRVHRMPAISARLVDATGAGDSMLAGYVAAILAGLQPVAAACYGSAAAAITVESEHTVSPNITAEAVAARLALPGTEAAFAHGQRTPALDE